MSVRAWSPATCAINVKRSILNRALSTASVTDTDRTSTTCLQGRVSFFVGVQLDITQPEEEEDGTAPGKVATPPPTDPAAAAAGASWCAVSAAAAQEAPCQAGRVGLVHKTAHMSATGAIRVAVRSLGGEQGLRRSMAHQGLPRSSSSPLASRQGSAKSIGSLSPKSLPETGTKAGEGARGL